MSSTPVRCTLALAVSLALCGAAQADSGTSVGLRGGNELLANQGGGAAAADPRGSSWLRPGQRRSPSGNLYACPLEAPELQDLGDWRYAGHVQFGYLSTGIDDSNALWNRYVAWDSGLVLGLLEIALRRPADGSYVDVRASRISSDDQFLQAAFGRAGSYKVQALLREMPNITAGDARSIWSGVGGNNLILLPGLVPGGSSSAQVAAVAAGVPGRNLTVTRSKTGLSLDAWLSPRWSAYGALSEEQRRGARPFGGAFFYNFIYTGNAGVLETPRPVDDSTININGGLRFAGNRWRMDLGYTGSFYRDRYLRLDFQSPFTLTPTRPNATSAPVYQGQFALEPDNDYHNLRATLTRRLPWNGELSLTASGGRMRQDDDLIAPVNCQGSFGVDTTGSGVPGGANRFLYNCADWNTPASLSRRSADMQIDTLLFDGRFTLQPSDAWLLRGGLTFNREDYRNTYLAYNPLTGDYGYITENGAAASIQAGAVGTWNPQTSPSVITRVRSLPLDQQTTAANLGADWRLSPRNTLSLTWLTERDEPTHRERTRVDRDTLKLGFSSRALDWLTLRASYAWLEQDGGPYDYSPYDSAYSVSLPGFVAPTGGIPAFTVDALRKYDLADRREHKLDFIATAALGDNMTLGLNLRGDWNDYGAQIGRQAYDREGASLQWDWQPSTRTQASAYYGYDRARLRMAAVADLVFGPDASLGGPDYPDEARWWAYDKQRNRNAGATLRHDFGGLRLDMGWNRIDARGLTSYRYNSPVALAYFADGIGVPPEGQFPLMRYRVDALTVGLDIPLSRRFSLRLFDYIERGRIADWHYEGLEQSRVIDHRVYIDGGPQSYTSNLVGLLLDIRL
jgi:Putative outer membrane beta-barrel porin, MtrB/PioB